MPPTASWPLAGLAIRARDGLELRVPGEADLTALAELARAGIHDPAEMPFFTPWTDRSPDGRAVSTLQYHWRCRAEWAPAAWRCPLAVVVAGAVVGLQEVRARDFAVTREAGSGSYLGRAHQGRGFGTRMRAAALAFAFDHLGAESVCSSAFVDNERSSRVSRRLGYREDGQEVAVRRGERVVVQRYRMTRADWRSHDRDPVEVQGLDACRGWFDSAHPGWPE